MSSERVMEKRIGRRFYKQPLYSGLSWVLFSAFTVTIFSAWLMIGSINTLPMPEIIEIPFTVTSSNGLMELLVESEQTSQNSSQTVPSCKNGLRELTPVLPGSIFGEAIAARKWPESNKMLSTIQPTLVSWKLK